MAAEVTDWISAVANVVAAVGTGGALLVGAVTFRRQVKDQHRQQASAVTVGHREDKEYMYTGEIKMRIRYFIRNDSPLPIYKVLLHSVRADKASPREPVSRDVLPAGEELTFYAGSSEALPVATFLDSSGVSWSRDGAGRLVERRTK